MIDNDTDKDFMKGEEFPVDDSLNNAHEEELTEWENPPSLQDLKADFDGAKIDHGSHEAKIQEWLDDFNGTKNKFIPKKGRSKIVPKLIRKQAEWRYPSLTEPFLSTDNIFEVEPITFEDKAAAEQNSLVLNNQFNTKIRKVAFIDSYVRKAVKEGTVIVRVGWHTKEEEVTRTEPIIEYQIDNSPENMQKLVFLGQVYQNDKNTFNNQVDEVDQKVFLKSFKDNIPYVGTVVGSEEITEIIETENYPTAKVRNYNNVIIDPSCGGDMDRAKFVIDIYDSSLAELKETGEYHNLDKIEYANNDSMGTEEDESVKDRSSFSFKDKPRKTLQVHEYFGYWDIDGNDILKPIVAVWVGNTLIQLKESPFPDGKLPFVLVPYLPDDSSLYGEPDGALIADNQDILGAVTRGMIDVMAKGANGQTGFQKGALDVTNKRKFNNGENYEYNTTGDPRSSIFTHTFPELSQSSYSMVQMQNNEAESFSGVKAYANSGITGNALGDSATGQRGALDATSKRELSILRRLAQGIIDIGRKFISMNAEFLSEEEVVRITNDKFVKVRREDLAGNFDLRLSITTAEEDNQKAQELAFMLQTIGPKVDPKITFMIAADIARLRKMPALAKKLEEYEPQPDPVAIEKAKLENELLAAKADNERAWAANRQAEAQKTLAEARKLMGAADQQDLDFIEQESGVKHARKKEEIAAQAQSQTMKSIVESQLPK